MRKLLQNFNMWPGLPEGTAKTSIYHSIETNRDRPEGAAKTIIYHPFEISLDTPSIYLYPQQKQEVVVKLRMLGRSVMTSSIPPYNDGWHTIVDPARPYNRIVRKYAPPFDNVPYGFLDYHAIRDGDWQEEEGWVVARRDLRKFLTGVLKEIGCNRTELEDYLYIVPRVIEEKYPDEKTKFLALPQYGKSVDESVKLEVKPKPAAVYRLWIYFKVLAAAERPQVRPPQLPKIRREGFHVVELGIVEDHAP